MSANWDVELCDCFSDIKVCLISWFCSPCQIAYQIAGVEGHECGISDGILPCLFPFCCAISVRGKIREKYGIQGSCMNDFCVVWLCGICAITQQTRQLQKKGVKPAGMFMD